MQLPHPNDVSDLLSEALRLQRPQQAPVHAALRRLIRRYSVRKVSILVGVSDQTVENWLHWRRQFSRANSFQILDLDDMNAEQIAERWHRRMRPS